MTKEIKVVVNDDDNKIEVYMDNSLIVSEEVYSFDSAVNFLAEGDAESFLNVVKYARSHKNHFPKIKELSNVVNADDCYCSCLIKLSRHLGEGVENTLFSLFKAAIEDKNSKAEKGFIRMWDALKSVIHLCGSFNDCI